MGGHGDFQGFGSGGRGGVRCAVALGQLTYFNPLFPTIPLRTLVANPIGGYLIGTAVAVFSSHASLPPEARLFAVTGCLGASTTFSTFSAEIASLLSSGQFGWALAGAVLHLLGSLSRTFLGMATGGYILHGKPAFEYC